MRILELTPTVPHLFPRAKAVLTEPLFSHRSERFTQLFRRTSKLLRRMSGPRYHPIMAAGTGSWANELMVWNLLPHKRHTAVIANGEFGERLFRQAKACRHDTVGIHMPWGEPYDLSLISETLNRHPEIDFVLCVATETSCSQSNDLQTLNDLLSPRNILMGADGVSAIGVTPELFKLSQLIMLTGSSGKALAGLPGISLVFCDCAQRTPRAEGVPELLDLNTLLDAEDTPGMVRNTLGSVSMGCLEASLEEIAQRDYPALIHNHKHLIVNAFRKHGIEPLPHSTSPMVTTFRRPAEPRWKTLISVLEQAGILLYTTPKYLEDRALFQVATMGDVSDADIDRLLTAINDWGKK